MIIDSGLLFLGHPCIFETYFLVLRIQVIINIGDFSRTVCEDWCRQYIVFVCAVMRFFFVYNILCVQFTYLLLIIRVFEQLIL